jgi:hypothetical protein
MSSEKTSKFNDLLLLQKYEEWRDGLPDMGWLNEVFPDNEQWQKFSNGVITLTDKFKDSIEIGWLHHPANVQWTFD